MKQKKGMAFLLLLAIMLTLVFPIGLQAAAAQKNAITELGVKKLPEGSTMKVGETYNFDPKILKTERGKGKTTGVVWWEVNAKTNTAGVASSRWGVVSPICAGSFEIRALAFADKEQMNLWRKNHAEGEQYITASTDWITISVTSESEGYALVRTQKQLNRALAKRGCTDIHIVTDEEVTFTIASRNYWNRTLTVNAPNADVINAARFGQIKIDQIKESTFFERAKGNRFYITAPNASLRMEENARVREISFEPDANAVEEELPKLHIINEGGNIANIRVVTKGNLILSGKSQGTTPVVVEETAAGTKVEIGVKAVLDLKADTVIETAKEAAKTIINLIAPKIKVEIVGEAAQDTKVNIAEEAADAEISTKVSMEIFVKANANIEIGEGGEESVIRKDENITVETNNKTDAEIITSDLAGNHTSVVKPGESTTETTTPAPTAEPVPTVNPGSGSGSGGSIPAPVPTTNPNPTATPTPTATTTPTPTPASGSAWFLYTIEGTDNRSSACDENYNIIIQLSKNEIGKKLQFIGAGAENKEKYQISPEMIVVEEGTHQVEVTMTAKDNPANKVVYKVTVTAQQVPAFDGYPVYFIEGDQSGVALQEEFTDFNAVPVMKNDIGKKLSLRPVLGSYDSQNYILTTDPQEVVVQDGETKVNITITAKDNPENKVTYTVTFIVKPVPEFTGSLNYRFEDFTGEYGNEINGLIRLSKNDSGRTFRFISDRFYQISPETITIEEGTHQVDVTITAKDNPENKVVRTITIIAQEIPAFDGSLSYSIEGENEALSFSLEDTVGTATLMKGDIGKKIDFSVWSENYESRYYMVTTDPQEPVVLDGETKVNVTVAPKDNPENKVVYTVTFTVEPIPEFNGSFHLEGANHYFIRLWDNNAYLSKSEIGKKFQIEGAGRFYRISPETIVIQEGTNTVDITITAKDDPANQVVRTITITAKEVPAFEGSLGYQLEGEKENYWQGLSFKENIAAVTLMKGDIGKKIKFDCWSERYDSRYYMLTTDLLEPIVLDGETKVILTITAKDDPENKVVYTITFTISDPSQDLPLPDVSVTSSDPDAVTTLSNGVVVVSGSAIDVPLAAELSGENASKWSIVSYTWYEAESEDAEGTEIAGNTESVCQVSVEENKKMYYYVKIKVKPVDYPDAEEKEIISKKSTDI